MGEKINPLSTCGGDKRCVLLVVRPGSGFATCQVGTGVAFVWGWKRKEVISLCLNAARRGPRARAFSQREGHDPGVATFWPEKLLRPLPPPPPPPPLFSDVINAHQTSGGRRHALTVGKWHPISKSHNWRGHRARLIWEGVLRCTWADVTWSKSWGRTEYTSLFWLVII